MDTARPAADDRAPRSDLDWEFPVDAWWPGLLLVLQSERYLHRVVDSVTPHRSWLHRQFSIDVTIPEHTADPATHEAEATTLLPIISVKKGQFFDDLTVSVDGSSVPVLNRQDHNEFAQRLVASYAGLVIQRAGGDLVKYEHLIDQLCDAVIAEPKMAGPRVEAFFAGSAAGVQSGDEAEVLRADPLLRRVCERLALEFYLVIQVPRTLTGRSIIKVAFTTSYRPKPPAGTRMRDRAFGALVRLGLQQPPSYTFLATMLKDARSYHFKTQAPPAYLVEEQILVLDASAPETGGNREVPPPPGHPYDKLNRFAARSVHVYINFRDLDRDSGAELQDEEIGVGVTFFPHPFGPTLQAAVVGLLSACVLLVVLGNHDVLFQLEREVTGVTALIGAPGAIALLAHQSSRMPETHGLAAPLRVRMLSFAAAAAVPLVAAVAVPAIRTFASPSVDGHWPKEIFVLAVGFGWLFITGLLIATARLWARSLEKLWAGRTGISSLDKGQEA